MKIEPLIWQECPTVDAYAGVDSVERDLLQHGFLVVVKEGRFHGLLVADDIIEKHHNLVIDCLRAKPSVGKDDTIQLAFGLMKAHRLSLLPVVTGNRFLGVITQTGIIDHLSRQGEAFEQQIASHVQELMQLNAQLRAEIVERKQAETHAKAANRAKTNFLANISHEIRTPLHIVIGFSQILEERVASLSQDQVIDQLHKIQSAGHHLLALISQILDLSMAEEEQVKIYAEPVSPKRLLETLVALFQHEAHKKGNRLECACDARIGMVLGDSLRLRQVLLNLLSNANKFTENGEIALRAQLVGNPEGRQRITFSVEDTGIGIAKEDLATIFEPFNQRAAPTMRGQGGFGLGLAISKKLVENMGGKIHVESHPQEGCQFAFTLDCIPLPTEQHQHPRQACAPPFKPSTILLIEDDALSCMMLEDLLAVDGHRVVTVGTAQAAFKALGQERFDLVLTDLRLPDVDGLEIIRHMRTLPDPLLAATPILVLTADALSERLRACLDAGANAIMTKPVELTRLRSTLACLQTGASLADGLDGMANAFPAPNPILDTDVLNSTLQSLGGERVLRICQQFPDSCAKTIQEMEKGVANLDHEQFRRAAHRFAGSATHLGMRLLVALVREIEEQTHLQDPKTMNEILRQFKLAVHDSQEQLDLWLLQACAASNFHSD